MVVRIEDPCRVPLNGRAAARATEACGEADPFGIARADAATVLGDKERDNGRRIPSRKVRSEVGAPKGVGR